MNGVEVGGLFAQAQAAAMTSGSVAAVFAPLVVAVADSATEKKSGNVKLVTEPKFNKKPWQWRADLLVGGKQQLR